jgi:phosphotriesterase-related protein
LSCSATGAAFGHPGTDTPYSHVLTSFVPALRAEGVDEDDVQRILVTNPHALLTVKES